MVQTAVNDAVMTTPAASVDAAVAAANRAILSALMPAQMPSIEASYNAAIASIADSPAKTAGVAAGERAATALLAARAEDKVAADQYRPFTVAGTYVPTAAPAASQWNARKPWLMTSVAQYRPGPPPSLTSEAWTRDFNEVKTMGAKASTARSAEQSDIARFWEYSLPNIYYGVVQSVANAPGRDVKSNARLYMAVTQAMDDALMAVFEAKYHYNFWRPVTAIRNADMDGNDATQREAGWTPFIDTPMHPEYPSGHSVLASSVAAVLDAEIGKSGGPLLTTTSPTAKNAARSWATPAEFVREVSNARVYGGMHYRSATQAGESIGQKIGELAAAKYAKPIQYAAQ
jgi:PAP2 superfamily protein